MTYIWACYNMGLTGTVFLTVLVSFNRYIAVCKPFKSAEICSLEQARKQVAYIIIIAVLYNIPRFFEYDVGTDCNEGKITTTFVMSNLAANKLYGILYSNILYFLIMLGSPLASLTFLNVNLIKALKKRAQKRNEMGKSSYQQDMTLVLVVVICVFIACQTPTFVDRILWTILGSPSCGDQLYYYTAIGDLLAIFNSSVNFLIYVITSRKFRQLLVSPPCTNNPDYIRANTAPSRADMGMVQVNNHAKN